MSQWAQGQSGYQYPLQTGFPGQNQSFQQAPFIQPQGGLAPQSTTILTQRPPFQQSQQAGFSGTAPALLPQQTGFPGSFQQQPRPPIPPVPPLPSQFQQQAPPPLPSFPASSNLLAVNQQNRLINSSPGFGGSTFGPQQAGFPSQGAGLQSLVPQITGIIDPRLQMMSSTFLPANPSSPYNPTGAPQLLQPQQQLGGLSLQQSFQQHNQEVKGTATPRVPWTLSKAEKKSYDQIFRAWDTSSSGFIDGKTAIEVFEQSGLGRNDLARIWTLADVDNRGKLNIAEFHVAMGLIYRKLNGNEIPDELPAELVPPSHRDLDTSVNFVKNLLQNEPSRARSPSGLDSPISRLPNRSLHSSSAPGAGGRQDATVYKHTDEEPVGGYYTPRSRHLDRNAVRASSERDSPAADLSDMKRQLENTARMLDRATEESALRTAEDDALDRELSDLKWKVKRVQEDLEYASRGPRSFRADEERRRLERELLELMHERVPAVEKKLAEREERRARQKREWDRERDRRNETFGRFGDRDRDRYGRSYSPNDNRDRYGGGYERDRVREKDYRDDRSQDFDRDRSYRDRSRSREHNYDREHPRSSPAATRSPPPPPPPPTVHTSGASKPPPATTPLPSKSPTSNVINKNMTPEERRAFIQAEAQRRTAERMAAMGLSAPSSSPTPKPTLDTSTEDRLAREKKEAEEKARAAEEAATERARQRDERLRNERGGGTPTVASPAAAAPSPPVTVTPKVPPPVKPRAPAPPPPRKPGVSAAARSIVAQAPSKPPFPVATPRVPEPAPVSAPRVVDTEEEEFRAREEALRRQKEERLQRMRRLEEEEREEEAQRQREEAARKQREQEEMARKAKQDRMERLKRMEEEEEAEAKREEEAREARRARTPAPAPPPVPAPPTVPPPPPAPPTAIASHPDRGKNNPFNRLISGGASPAVSASPQNNDGNNPFFRSQPVAPTPPIASNTTTSLTLHPPTSPAPPLPAPVPPPPSKSPAPPVVKTSYHTAPGDSEDEWAHERDDDDDSSEDELNSSRDTRDRLARQLFGSILPPASGPPRSQSAASANVASKTPSPTAVSVPTPPPPPPAPVAPPAPPAAPLAPPAPVVVTPAPTGDRSALLDAIQSGTRLRKAVTNDRSASAFSGRVLGDTGPTMPAGTSSENVVNTSRQSIDWYMGLATDQGTQVSQEPSLPPMGEEDEEQARKEVNGHAAPVPGIEVAHAGGAASDPLEDIDRSTEYRVKTLYPYDGQRAEDLTFSENVVISAHPSKTSSDWWYGTLVSSGKAGFFPKTYVQAFETVKAKCLYDYQGGNADDLPFSEGDMISVVDRSDSDWYKAEKDGVIFSVPAAYLEIVEDDHVSSSRSVSMPSHLGPSPLSIGMTTTLPTAPSPSSRSLPLSHGLPGETDDIDNESASDPTSSDYHSFSDSDTDGAEAAMTEEERRLEHEMRAAERHLVLEAAGIVVKQDTTRRPPARLQRRRSLTGVRPRHRPPPAPPSPIAPVPSTSLDLDKPQPPTPTQAHIDDAYERYEAFKQHAFRLSISSIEQLPDQDRGKDNVNPSVSYGSRITQLLARARTPEARVMPTISAPILSTSSSGKGNSGTSAREDNPAFGSSWASLVDKSALEGLPDRERRRQEAIFELIATEGAYVRDLQLIVEIFYSSMLRLLEPKTIAVIFANVEDILLTNTTFLSSLEERQRNCRLYIDTIGDILDKHLRNMGIYKHYCINQAYAIRILQSLKDKNEDLAVHLQRLREDPAVRNLDLSSYLLVPMQRITRYPLLIKQILQYTEPDQDRGLIERALYTAEKILENINETIREQESRDRLKMLSQDLWIGQGRLDLTAPTRHLGNRKLLREGLLNKAKSGRKLRAFLCNDILLLTDEHGKTLYRMPIPLSEIHVQEAPGLRDELSFQLSVAYPRGGDKITLKASSTRERNLWMTDIEMASRKCKDVEKAVALKGHDFGY